MKKKKEPELTISYRKLGRQRARGAFFTELNAIEIDPRLSGEEHLEVLSHEALHYLFPWLDEEAITASAPKLARILWTDGYRKLKI